MRPLSLYQAFSAVLLGVLLVASLASGDRILEARSASLITYVRPDPSNIQFVRPLPEQRGITLDGTAVASASHGVTLHGNPLESAHTGISEVGGVRLATGTYVINDVDIALPAEIPWVVSRSYNARQYYDGAYYDSGGYQGYNWFQNSQPEIAFHDDNGSSTNDMIYLVYGADRYIEFRRDDVSILGSGDSSTTFRAVNGGAGVFKLHTFDGIELATLYDSNGMRLDFFWFGDDDVDDDIEGSLWRIMDPSVTVNPYNTGDRLETGDGNVAYVGDVGNPNTALSSYNTTTGGITSYAYDSAGRRFTYTYTSNRLTQVKAEINSGSWVEVARVDYDYYGDYDTTSAPEDAFGSEWDLRLVTITTPLTDSGVSYERRTYFRYYTDDTYHADDNPGYPHMIEYIISSEGARRYDWAQDGEIETTSDPEYFTASENNLKPYASAFFEYDTSRRIKEAWFNGACGCAGSSGTHTFEYETNSNYTNEDAGYDFDEEAGDDGEAIWRTRVIVKKPIVTYDTTIEDPTIESWVTQYFDEAGQPLHTVFTDADPDNTDPAPRFWATKVVRDANGVVVEVDTPSSVTAYTHSSASFTVSESAGLIYELGRISSGDRISFLDTRAHRRAGSSSDAYFDADPDDSTRSLTVGDAAMTRAVRSQQRVYPASTTTAGSGYEETTSTYTFYADPTPPTSDILYITPKKLETSYPVVDTARNGSNSATVTRQYFRKDGSTAFSEAQDGVFTYFQHTDGQLVMRIDDVDTTDTTDIDADDDPNGTWGVTETSTGVHRVTTYTYDNQGRLDTTTLPDGRVLKQYYSELSDGRLVTLSYTKFVSGSPPTVYGPVQYTVTNHAGKVEVQAVVALSDNGEALALTSHIDESLSDPITAMDLGTVARMTVNSYDEAGTTLEESWLYSVIPGSGLGSDGTNYDPTKYAYDDQGRLYRTLAPHGTITRTDYDTLGRVVRQWIGTDDSDFDGGAGSSDNMVKTVENEYDGSGSSDKGNSYLTKRTIYIQDSDTGKRETSFSNDSRGRMLLQTSPTAPHIFNKYDNLGRLVASGQFSSTASITASSDDPTTETANRLALNQTFYDDIGRVYKTQRHKIDDADGSDDDNLQSLTWYDSRGRVIKRQGPQFVKSRYDRLGRQTRQFTLAETDDTTYAHADDVDGDIVLVEQQTVYESTNSDSVFMSVSIERHHDDYSTGETTGVLDSNADADDLLLTAANIEGRPQITAMWYEDAIGRLTDTVMYGNNGGSNFDRDGGGMGDPPTRSDTELRTTNVYNDDGSLKSITDPRGKETRYEYDAVGRRKTVIAHYVNGTPSAATGDDDVHTRYVYTDGLQAKMWVDLDGDNTEDSLDQVTTYTYGTVKGTSAGESKIATGHLLQKVTYPDSTSGTDVVSYAYNAQSQEMWRKDQAGGIIESDYDDSGRRTHERVTTLASGFDGAVRRISTTYDSLGRRQLVTQYDNATAGSGSAVNEVKFTYEDWGNLEKMEQDHNSTVGASGSVDDLEVSYQWEKSSSSSIVKTVRKRTVTLPGSLTVNYSYSSTGGLHDADASRVTKLTANSVDLVRYWYNGSGSVVGTVHDEPDIYWNQFTTSGNYPDLDRFNRVTSSRWTKDIATDFDFFDLDITYDRNSNIELVEDNIHIQSTGWDVDYTIDNINRLTQAKQGTWNGSSITSAKHDQQWTLSQTGNWRFHILDVNGNGTLTDSGDLNEDNPVEGGSEHFNTANEWTARDIDNDDDDDFTLVYDTVGNMTDDDEHYKYEYDAFGRLRKVKKTSDSSLVAEYTYNGLGYRIGWHYDTEPDNDVDSNDPWYRFAYDERWRIVATYHDDDADLSDEDPKEQFVYHNAGFAGVGGSSYIDDVILRDKDANTAWTSASDGTLEERVYYCHNWRHDVSVLISSAGTMVEWVKYSAYGIPFGIPVGDTNSDGTVNSTDISNASLWNGQSNKPTADTNLDGTINGTDQTKVSNQSGTTLGWWALSDVGNRKGYAGYELDPELAYAVWHVRHRVLNSDLGRWTRRDPLGYVDGLHLYAYLRNDPLGATDPTGRSVPPDLHPQPPTNPFGNRPTTPMNPPIGPTPPTVPGAFCNAAGPCNSSTTVSCTLTAISFTFYGDCSAYNDFYGWDPSWFDIGDACPDDTDTCPSICHCQGGIEGGGYQVVQGEISLHPDIECCVDVQYTGLLLIITRTNGQCSPGVVP